VNELQHAESVASGKRRFVWYDGALWWRIYQVGGYDGYRTLKRRLPCGELARRLQIDGQVAS
jgi:hypothetical protein